MRHFSEYEKEIIKLIVEKKHSDPLVFGDFAKAKVFASEESALLKDTTCGGEPVYILFCKDAKSRDAAFEKLNEVISLIQYMEKEGLISVFELIDSYNILGITLFYEGSEYKDFKIKNDKIYISQDQYLCTPKNKPTCYIKRGNVVILEGFRLEGPLAKELPHIFESLIYPRGDLIEFVKNNFVTDEERRFRGQLCATWIAIMVSIIGIIIGVVVSPVISVRYGNCHGRTTLKEEQYEGLKSAIISSYKEDAPEAVCPACDASGKLAPDSINQKCDK